MQNEESQLIVQRFFLALDMLKSWKVTNTSKFCDRYGINRRHLWMLRNEPQRDILKLCWLTYLVRDYGLNAEWLLTGEQPIFKRLPNK